MGEPYVGEIRMFAGNYAPSGWAICQGQQLAVSDYETLFEVIGTTYGGDGETTFALPDLRGRFPMHQGNNHVLGEQGGAEQVMLTVAQIPGHTHVPGCDANAGDTTSQTPAGNVWSAQPFSGTMQAEQPPAEDIQAAQPLFPAFSGSGTENVNMNVGTMSGAGGSQPHDNMMPFLAINFIISLYGIIPPPA